MKRLLLPLALLAASVAVRNSYINSIVPEPYLDEVFHIPQAQHYCHNAFHIWDPKLTTPAGLYLLSYPLSYFSSCTPSALRNINGFGVSLVLPLLVYRIRQALHDTPEGAVHTAVNVALFPLTYFFGGLYYTDVWSVVFVLAGYLAVLKGRPWVSGVYCAVAMGFRQTNVLWTGFLAGVWVTSQMRRLAKIRDPSIETAGMSDYILTPISLLTAALRNPLDTIRLALPFAPPLAAFAAFLIWNNYTIVLGDATAHEASLHTPQLFYFTAATAFFSFPFYLPLLRRFLPPSPTLLLLSPLFLIPIAAAIKFNTVLHPYLLADNRHYTFYVFRKLIRPLPWWVPVPVYWLAGVLQYWAAEVRVSWMLLWVGATAAGLVTAPLVEPRYFVVAWAMWRCCVPGRGAQYKWLETAWFVVINLVTTYVFLYRGFSWENEPGNVQRFMW